MLWSAEEWWSRTSSTGMYCMMEQAYVIPASLSLCCVCSVRLSHLVVVCQTSLRRSLHVRSNVKNRLTQVHTNHLLLQVTVTVEI
jgi:hypothetical protein